MSMCNMEQGTKTSPAVEVWKDIEGYEGMYQVSNLGKVRSLDRWYEERNAYMGITKRKNHKKGRILKVVESEKGYFRVFLKKNYTTKVFLIHRLVAEAFVPNPFDLLEVNHKDENKLNNRADNLEWCDRIYNVNYGTGIARRSKSIQKTIEQLSASGEHIRFIVGIKKNLKRLGFDKGFIYKVIDTDQLAYGFRWRHIT